MVGEIERLRAEIRSTLNPSCTDWRAKVLRWAAWLTAPAKPPRPTLVEYLQIEDLLTPEQLVEHKARHDRELAESMSRLIGEGRFDDVLRSRILGPQIAR